MEHVKTIGLLTLLTVLFVWVGGMVGGAMGMVIAFLIASGMNVYSYYFSDTMVLKHYNAIEVNERDAHGLFEIVQRLSKRANLPMPRIYIIPDQVPNAFATGRDHNHAVVAVSEGLLNLLDVYEVEGVLAHELSHVKHYDILIGTVAASIAGAISMIANFMHFGSMFGGGGENRPNPIIMLILAMILPMAAMVIQMTVSRSREYMADKGAANMTGHPEWLQSALAKLDHYARAGVMKNASQETAHMFIINPFSGKNISFKSLFSTHPSTESRIERLEELKHQR